MFAEGTMDVPAFANVLGPVRPTGKSFFIEIIVLRLKPSQYVGISMDLPSHTDERFLGLILDQA